MMRRVLFVAAVLFALAAVRPAQAQWGFGGYGTNYYGYGLPAGWYTGVNDRVPPYFALHPPVYYSGQVIQIPYGASPFAYPWGCPFGCPGMVTEEESMAVPPTKEPAPEPISVTNQFYKGKPGAGALTAPKNIKVERERGVMIPNPFFKPDNRVAKSK